MKIANSRISQGIGTKPGTVTKLDKRNTTMSNKVDDDVMLANCDITVFFSISNLQPSGSWIPDAWSIKLILINSNLLSYKTWKQNQKISYTALILLLWVKVMVIFLQKNTDIGKIKGILVLESILSKTTYVCVLTYQISSFWYNSNEF